MFLQRVNGDITQRSSIGLGLLAILIAFIVAPASSSQGSLLLVESNSYVSIGVSQAREKVILEYVGSQNPENVLRDNIRIHGAVSVENVYDSSGALQFSVENLENGWRLVKYTLGGTLSAGYHTQVTIEFTKTVENIGGNRVYNVRYMWSATPTSYQVIAKLPKGGSLTSTSENPSELYTENESLYMLYSGVMMNSFQTYIVFKAQEQPSAENQQMVAGPEGQAEGDRALLYVALVVVASLGAVLALRVRARKPPVKAPGEAPKVTPKREVEKILMILSDQERKIIEELIKEDGLTQATLCGRTGTPKATMSRVLQRLEDKGLVRRVGYGMSKKVMLTGLAKGWRA